MPGNGTDTLATPPVLDWGDFLAITPPPPKQLLPILTGFLELPFCGLPAYKINHIYLATWIKLGQDVWCWSSVYCVPWIFLNALCIFSKHSPGRDQSSPCFRWGNRRTKNNASRLQLHVATLGFNPRMLDSRAYNLVLALEVLTS